jgi:F-type H+-transporting ATPase subunit b
MGLVTPNPGTLFWMLIIFGIVVFMLQRFAWKPILNALEERTTSISNALSSADFARKQLDELKTRQEEVKAFAIREKDQILKEAREIKDKILAEAREKALLENEKILAQLKVQIENEKTAALNEMKEKIAGFSVLIAEKILKERLESTPHQEELIQHQLREFKLN